MKRIFQLLPFSMLVTVFLLLTFSSCQKEDTEYYEDLKFSKETYFVPLGHELQVNIQRGNGDYEVVAADEALFEWDFSNENYYPGYFKFKGKKIGITTLTVADKKNAAKVNLTIHVVDPFQFFQVLEIMPQVKIKDNASSSKLEEIRQEILKYRNFEKQQVILLKANAKRDYYIFKDDKSISVDQILEKGLFQINLFTDYGPSGLTLIKEGSSNSQHFKFYFPSNEVSDYLKVIIPKSAQNQELKASNRNYLAESPLPPNDYFHIYNDVTSEIAKKFPEVESASVFHYLHILFRIQESETAIDQNLLIKQ